MPTAATSSTLDGARSVSSDDDRKGTRELVAISVAARASVGREVAGKRQRAKNRK